MLKRALCLLPLLVVACAVESTSDDVGQTSEAVTPPTGVVLAPASISLVTYQATDTTIAISYVHANGAGGANTLSLTSSAGGVTVGESSVGSSRFGTTFTGLQTCTA